MPARKGEKDRMEEALSRARDLLTGVTPLKHDCGRICGAACCQPDEDGRGGMLLFPGEEELYDPLPEGFRVAETEQGLLLTCEGVCDRKTRPLSCMLFPVWIFPKGDGFCVKADRRGFGVCPLACQGVRSLDPDFIAAVKQAAELLWKCDEQRAFLKGVAAYIDLLKVF
ncbi:MAG: hypothetical protein CW338_05725 [Clostridiales bacterium]|nr:hypothetical protein [Clostridiales bacterium]